MLPEELQSKLVELCGLLVDQERARVIVAPQEPLSGYWFGGGNMVVGSDQHLYIVGRYRNVGDSRTGVTAGARGLELAVFRSTDRGSTFTKVLSFDKAELSSSGKPVLSIEGSALGWERDQVELYVSTEKDNVGYPKGYEEYLKPGTGVWSVDRLQADSLAELKSAEIRTMLSSHDPNTIHVKDPFLYDSTLGKVLFFCSHPFSWSSSNTGYALLDERTTAETPVFSFFPRGLSWDVAMSRGTCVLDVPRVGPFEDHNVSLLFYDGGECLRNHEQHGSAHKRPRGYSCEELGGVAYFTWGNWVETERLSKCEPLFVSPFGTGCSRYLDILPCAEGMYVTWQQSQNDGSQPLVMNFVSQAEIEATLNG